MKYVYELARADLNEQTRTFEFWRSWFYSSETKVRQELEVELEVNKATNIERDDEWGSDILTQVDYSTKSTENNPMRIRIVAKRHKIR